MEKKSRATRQVFEPLVIISSQGSMVIDGNGMKIKPILRIALNKLHKQIAYEAGI